MLKIYVMSKGELQEFKIPDNCCLINYHDFKAQNIQEVQDTSISKNTSILDLYKKNKILNIERKSSAFPFIHGGVKLV